MENIVVVTGAGHRVGAEVALRLLDEGYSVIAHYRTSCCYLRECVEQRGLLKKIVFCKADFLESTTPLLTEIEKYKLNIIGFIQCASIFVEGTLINCKEWEAMLKLHALIPLDLAKHYIETVGRGSITLFSDANIKRFNSNFQAYRSSKLLGVELFRQLATVAAPSVRVNLISPGTVLPPEKISSSYTSAMSLAPGGAPKISDLLDSVLLLLNNDSLVGQNIYVDGGVHCL